MQRKQALVMYKLFEEGKIRSEFYFWDFAGKEILGMIFASNSDPDIPLCTFYARWGEGFGEK